MKLRKTELRSLALLAVTTLVVAACSDGGYTPPPPPPANVAPTIAAITDKMADQDTVVTVEFGIEDRETAAASLIVSAAADGTALFPADGVVLSGSGATRTLTLTPLEATTGTATIAVRVADPQGAVATRSFQVAVNARNASVRALTFDTFAKSETDAPTTINGLTIQQDADDPAVFAALLGAE
jgi:phage-related tail protein